MPKTPDVLLPGAVELGDRLAIHEFKLALVWLTPQATESTNSNMKANIRCKLWLIFCLMICPIY